MTDVVPDYNDARAAVFRLMTNPITTLDQATVHRILNQFEVAAVQSSRQQQATPAPLIQRRTHAGTLNYLAGTLSLAQEDRSGTKGWEMVMQVEFALRTLAMEADDD